MNTTSTPQTIRSFPESSLPDNIHDRLETLFRTKDKWSVDEIAPYVECLSTPTLNVNGLLTKYVRLVPEVFQYDFLLSLYPTLNNKLHTITP